MTISKSHYRPYVLVNYVHRMGIDGYSLEIAFWDTAGQEEWDRLRPLSYPGSAVIAICFAVDGSESVDAVSDTWYPKALLLLEAQGPDTACRIQDRPEKECWFSVNWRRSQE